MYVCIAPLFPGPTFPGIRIRLTTSASAEREPGLWQKCVYVYVCEHACMNVCVCMYVSMYACMCECMYVCVCLYVCMCEFVCACV